MNIPNPKATREPTRTFTFDLVFGPESTQAEIYNETARPIVDAVLEGYNGEWLICVSWFSKGFLVTRGRGVWSVVYIKASYFPH